MKKRFLSIFLALCMVLTAFPTYALAVESGGTIQGTVVDIETQKPIEIEVMVSLHARDNLDTILAYTTCDIATGAYTLALSEGISTGLYTLVFTSDLYLSRSMDIELTSNDGLVIAAATGLYPIGRCDGTVTDATTGAALSGVAVNIYKTNEDLSTSTTTGMDGTYSIETQAGIYDIEFVKSGYAAAKVERVSLGAIAVTQDMQMTARHVNSNIWDGSIAENFAGGSGTKDDPYQIENGAQLAKLSSGMKAGNYYVLTSNIYLNDTASENWHEDENVNIWTSITDFNGTLDGQSHYIYGLYPASLFGEAAGTLKNINISETLITKGYMRGSTAYVGTVAGYAENVIGCSNEGTITYNNATDSAAWSYVGGITGTASNIDQCYNIGSISGVDSIWGYDAGRISAGGIVGYSGGYISNCYNLGKISAGGYYPSVGGIVGDGRGAVTSCYSTPLSKSTYYYGDIIGVTSNNQKPTLTYCYCSNILVGPALVSKAYGEYIAVSCGVLSEAEMREKDSYVGFDFETIWDIDANVNDGYPILRHVGNLSGDIPDPDPDPDNEITFSVDVGKTFTINVGEQLAIQASFSPIEGMTENSVMWFTDDPDVADIDHIGVGSIGPEITSSIGWINGIAPGTANISVALPDGRTGSVEVTVKEKDGSNIPLKDFNVSVYRADLLANRTNTPYSRTLFNLLSTRSPSKVIQEELYSDWSLLNAVDAWNAICNTFDTVENPYNLHDLSFEEQDFYTAILMDILETNVSHRQTSSMESFVKTSKSLVGEATSFVKLKFDIKDYDNPFASEEDKENIANAYMEYFKTELKFGTWDTNHVILGYMDKVFEHYGKIMNAVDSLEDFADRIVSAFALVAMSDSTKNVVRELYANCPTTNQPLRAALLDIIRIMDSSEDQLIAELVSNTLTVVGENACSKLVSKFWNKAILSCVPEVKILISSYKAGKWVSDKLFGTSKIAEECNKIVMTTVFESLMVSTVQKLGWKFNSAQDISSADTFLKSVDIYFSVLDHSADQAVSFVDSVDSGWFPKIWNCFNPGGNESKESLKKSIESIRATYSDLQNSLWNGWIVYLEIDYPSSGLYEMYSPAMIPATANNKVERKIFQVRCPVDVLVYDSRDNLVAYAKDGKVHCDDDIDLTLIVLDDEKTVIFYDGADYRMECVSTDTGTMDVIITEYSTAGEQIRDVYFYDLPLQQGTTYETVVDDQVLDGVTYQLTSTDGDIFSPDLDTYNPLGEKYTLNIVSGAADIEGEDVFTADLFAGQQINIMAYTPKNCKFTGWTSNVAGTVFGDATQESTILTMPASDVVIRATIAETGYSVIFDANGGTCDTVVIATDLAGNLDTLPIPNYPGYSFQGWFTAAIGGNQLTVPTILAEDITVYAHWVPASSTVFTVTFDAYGGTVTPTTMTTNEEGKLAELPTPVREGYTFDGWLPALDGGEKITTNTVFTEDTTVYAHWTQIITPPEPTVFTITFNANNGTVTPTTMTTNEEGKLAELPIPVRNGYSFNGWFTALTGGDQVTTNTVFTSDATVYARWTYNNDISGGNNRYPSTDNTAPTTYRIIVPAVPGGTVNVSPASAKKGDTVTITVTPDSGYELDYITITNKNGDNIPLTDRGNGRYVFTMPDGNVTLDCAFKLIKTDSIEQPAVSFVDVVPGAYYYDAVAWAVAQGITNGTTVATFSPDAPCTRGQIVAFLWRAAGSPSVSGNNPFTDVQPGDYWYDAVLWAISKGIPTGTSATTFSPNDTCTRSQAVTFLYRNAGSPAVTTSASFTDVVPGAYYSDAVTWALAKNITNGTTATTFSPDDKCTRGQIVTLLYRNLGE